MQTDQINLIDRMFECNLWANSELIKLCGTLSEEQLVAEVEGVYGRIQPTLAHIIGAEGRYLKRLTGTQLWGEEVDWQNLSLDDLLEMAQQSGSGLIAAAGAVDPTVRHDSEWGPFYNWTVVLQALYHGIEHRTQIKRILTHLGVEHPELASWDYGESLQQS